MLIHDIHIEYKQEMENTKRSYKSKEQSLLSEWEVEVYQGLHCFILEELIPLEVIESFESLHEIFVEIVINARHIKHFNFYGSSHIGFSSQHVCANEALTHNQTTWHYLIHEGAFFNLL